MILKPTEELATVVWGNVTEVVRTQGTVGMTAVSLFPVSCGSSGFFVSSAEAAAVGAVTAVLEETSREVVLLSFPNSGLTNL